MFSFHRVFRRYIPFQRNRNKSTRQYQSAVHSPAGMASNSLESSGHGFSGITEVLECDAGSISFVKDGQPDITCPSTHVALARAASLLRSSSLVAFPTETVYGLGASALSPDAVRKIYAAKGRPSDNPLIVHVSSRAMLRQIIPPDWEIPQSYQTLMDQFWPGPLTLLFPTTSHAQPESKIPSVVTCGLPSVAVRMPVHPVARALIATVGVPLAAPSANASGRPSTTTAAHVKHDLSGRIELILDGGACGVGVESTVVDGLGEGGVRVLRLGGIGVDEIEACLRGGKVGVWKKDFEDAEMDLKPTTPGMKYKHYSPDARVVVIDAGGETRTTRGVGEAEEQTIKELCVSMSDVLKTASPDLKHVHMGLMLLTDSPLYQSLVPTPTSTTTTSHSLLLTPTLTLHLHPMGTPYSPAHTAQTLFSGLRNLDNTFGCSVIFIERVAETGLGATVMERVWKAAGGRGGAVRVKI